MSENKTHAEIIAEMNCGPIPEHRHDREILRYYAYELDAAHKREVDALNEQIADLRQQRDLWSKRAAELVEKCNEQYAKLKQVGNAAKLREALESVAKQLTDATEDENFGEDVMYLVGCMRTMSQKCRVTLSTTSNQNT